MKVGIYTQPLRLNYGGILQAWALQTTLLRKGFDAVTLATEPGLRLPPWRKPFCYGKRLLRKLSGQGGPIFFEEAWNRAYEAASRNIRPFIEKHVRRRIFRDFSEISEKEFDVLLAGSDQIWRALYHNKKANAIEHSFFDFARNWNVKRVAYAASFGTDEWEYTPEQTKECAELAQKFAAVSVREKSGIGLCRQHLGVEAIQVPDPTLLLNRTDYEALIEEADDTHEPAGDLLCYVLDKSPQSSELIRLAAERGQFTPFEIPMWKDSLEECPPQPSVEQWLRNFRDAKAVVTDSFHACVFSVIFGKPFLVLGNPVRGMSRYESLLGELHLMDRLATTLEEGQARLDALLHFPEASVLPAWAAMRERGNHFLQVLS